MPRSSTPLLGALALLALLVLTGCDPRLTPRPGPSATGTRPDPFAGRRLWVDPSSPAAGQAAAWRASRPADAARMDRMASTPQATWLGAWSGDITTAVDRVVSAASAAGALPVLVAYDIPERDCGGQSAGGAGSPDAYRRWVAGLAQGIGNRPAVVVLEPDALAGMTCLSAADQRTRLDLLAGAVRALEAGPGTAVYVDAGHAGWVGTEEMARRLSSAGVAGAEGFSLNVSSFGWTADQVSYARDLSRRLGGAHAVIDTSRNGLGPAPGAEWCNPPGRALGLAPTDATADPVVDAYLWVKRPGESDGGCNGGPPAGTWWPEHALGLAARAG